MLLKSKIAIVYGGGGAIGGAVAREFAKEGAVVLLAGRSAQKLEVVAKDIRSAGGTAETAVVDVLDVTQVGAHVSDAVARFGRIDTMLCAVGFMHIQGVGFSDVTLEQFWSPIEQFTKANFITSKAVQPHMSSGGVILTLTTPGYRTGGTGYIGFGTACSAIEGFSRLLALELGKQNIRVICLMPDAMPDTLRISYAKEMFEKAAASMGKSAANMLAERANAISILGRSPTLAEVASYAAFVSSDRASGITGTIANLSAGSTIDP